ncbi:solute carrier family 25 member 33-like [Gracilinanus agilis]|uniref:solute carrier family 25 member 33-like n=1 Tax=Gracilinanus agilis TaxID=191870 RepID=UPI001CFD2FC0|nr:solute carrier family 25 member 33-like [Gracilinanus agilis]
MASGSVSSQKQHSTLLHLFAGGVAGTFGAICTCPLEVLKTRLQSSRLAIPDPPAWWWFRARKITSTSRLPEVLKVLKSILEKEGTKTLFRGLGPNLIGVAPSRAVYFACYSKAKDLLNDIFVPNTYTVHFISAGSAGFITNTLMNPVWMIKSRMQLGLQVKGSKGINTVQCARYIYQENGISGFYRGLTASYFGIFETMICFAIYERVKKWLTEPPLALSANGTNRSSPTRNFFSYMAAAAIARVLASFVGYPHEVLRTRLREEGTKYRTFSQTVHLIAQEEGFLGFYRGLCAQLIWQVPNTGIVLSTYELIVFLMKDFKD